MVKLKSWITPSFSSRPVMILSIGWVIAVIGLVWLSAISNPAIFATPLETLEKIPELLGDTNFLGDIISSLVVNVEALALSIMIALPLGYMFGVPMIRPLTTGTSYLRFLSPAVFYTAILWFTSTGHQQKVVMLTIGEVVFLTASMIGIVQAIPQYAYDDASTLRMGPWQQMWYVTIRSTEPQTIDAIRINNAMGWSMLMMVEGFVRSEGGIGLRIVEAKKYMQFSTSYVLILVILFLGIGSDWVIGQWRSWRCPYAV